MVSGFSQREKPKIRKMLCRRKSESYTRSHTGRRKSVGTDTEKAQGTYTENTGRTGGKESMKVLDIIMKEIIRLTTYRSRKQREKKRSSP